MTINRDDWLAAIATVEPATDDQALTVQQLAVLLGMKETSTKERVKKLVAEGKAILTRKCVIDTLGRRQTVTAYRLTLAEKRPLAKR